MATRVRATKLEFGLKDETIEGEAVWGARCILDGRGKTLHLDVLPDRQDMKGDTLAREQLKAALNEGSLEAFQAAVESERVWFEQSRDVQRFTHGGVEFSASTMASYGYLYVTARMVPS